MFKPLQDARDPIHRRGFRKDGEAAYRKNVQYEVLVADSNLDSCLVFLVKCDERRGRTMTTRPFFLCSVSSSTFPTAVTSFVKARCRNYVIKDGSELRERY